MLKNSKEYADVVVTHVVNTDTIRIVKSQQEKEETIKLIGLRGPEEARQKPEKIRRDEFGMVIKEPVTPITPVEESALTFVKELLANKHVRLEFDRQKSDEDYATLAYVYLREDNTFVNEKILKEGYAALSLQPPNMKYEHILRQAYQEARKEKRGFHAQ